MINGDGIPGKAPLLTATELSGSQQLPAELHDDPKTELWSPPAELSAIKDSKPTSK
jgi:hypothetical protein